MKTSLRTLIIAAISFAAVWGLRADDVSGSAKVKASATSHKTSKSKAKRSTKEESTTLTGSYIKHPTRRAGLITDGSSQVLVLDRDAIDQTGATDLRQVLVRRGIR